MKITLITFFNIKGIVHFEFILQGQTINRTYCVEILKWLHEAVLRKRPELWTRWIHHYDNAPARNVLSAKQLMAQKIDY
jgi:hypothetical protein